jgi:hypothetical protein
MSVIKRSDDCCQIILLKLPVIPRYEGSAQLLFCSPTDPSCVGMTAWWAANQTLSIKHYDTHRMIVYLLMNFITVIQQLNQGVNRKPGCILVFGVLFGYFLDKQKVTCKKTLRSKCHACLVNYIYPCNMLNVFKAFSSAFVPSPLQTLFSPA